MALDDRRVRDSGNADQAKYCLETQMMESDFVGRSDGRVTDRDVATRPREGIHRRVAALRGFMIINEPHRK